MPELLDQAIRSKILDALTRSERGDGVLWKRLATESLRKHLPKITQRRMNRLLRQWVQRNGRIDQAEENREEYREEHEFHYDFRIPIGGGKYYIECRLTEDRQDDPELSVVNFKPVDSKV